eukprot:8013592-Pyramimonas_sp.AAC.1
MPMAVGFARGRALRISTRGRGARITNLDDTEYADEDGYDNGNGDDEVEEADEDVYVQEEAERIVVCTP